MSHKEIEDLIANRNEERKNLARIEKNDNESIYINNHLYKIIANKLDAFHFSDFSNKFNPIFTKYDFIVGDWGYGQLRLKGFYSDFKKVSKALKYSAIDDYLIEKSNVGAPYFILHNVDLKSSNNNVRKNRQQTKKSKYVDKDMIKKSNINSRYKNGAHRGFKIVQKNKME
ncbi:DUF1027 domain-containing protein [Lactobacillus sp. S2-2]|uniref:YutD family protein n=1 Tax=Lactobacillus sp. S2-2 TaxID=2692917 RepID=UPI001F1A5F6C|nr:YutD family protein [Lactobacillus sp. S2-2]MCF6515837.1 DUF1027 domain-containing protein [Lactobacillus sp. S2-2]